MGWIPHGGYHKEETMGWKQRGWIPQGGGNHEVETTGWIPQGGNHGVETMGWKQWGRYHEVETTG